MAKHLVTHESLQAMLSNTDPVFVTKVVGRALVVLMDNQTRDEKASNATNVDNGIGFTGADAFTGCLTAKSFLKHGTLQDWQVAKWTKPGKNGFSRLTKYWRQLDAAAVAKASKV